MKLPFKLLLVVSMVSSVAEANWKDDVRRALIRADQQQRQVDIMKNRVVESTQRSSNRAHIDGPPARARSGENRFLNETDEGGISARTTVVRHRGGKEENYVTIETDGLSAAQRERVTSAVESKRHALTGNGRGDALKYDEGRDVIEYGRDEIRIRMDKTDMDHINDVSKTVDLANRAAKGTSSGVVKSRKSNSIR